MNIQVNYYYFLYSAKSISFLVEVEEEQNVLYLNFSMNLWYPQKSTDSTEAHQKNKSYLILATYDSPLPLSTSP